MKKFRESWNYLKENRSYVYAVILLFAAGIVIGAAFSDKFTFIDDFLKGIAEKTAGMSTPRLILFIFQNNLQSAFAGLFFGIVLGIFSIFDCILNGVVLGYVMKRVWMNSGFWDFWRILPHGIFELPAIFISLALGLKLGMFIFAKAKIKELKKRLLNSAIIFVVIVIPLLVAAAIIEGLLILAYK
jgi:stage II sporulation protein M